MFRQNAKEPPAPTETLSPSDLGGAKALPGDAGQDEAAAKLRGTRLHLLLEHLSTAPQDQWPQLCIRLLPDMQDADRQELLNEAQTVLTADHLKPVFAASALTEVSVSADLHGTRLHGIIDRLIISDSEVHVIDFKSNATVPDEPKSCPDGLLRQMGAYAYALAQIYPNHEIRTAILWTRAARLMWLPHDLVTEAVVSHPIS